MTIENNPIPKSIVREIEFRLDEMECARIGAMIRQVNDMVADLRAILMRRPSNSKLAIAAAALNQARQPLEDALKSLQKDTVGIEVSHEVLPSNVVRIRIEKAKPKKTPFDQLGDDGLLLTARGKKHLVSLFGGGQQFFDVVDLLVEVVLAEAEQGQTGAQLFAAAVETGYLLAVLEHGIELDESLIRRKGDLP
ncbi:MAG: hypothetical protein V3V32_04340 [Dehalococcoidia bacterium]